MKMLKVAIKYKDDHDDQIIEKSLENGDAQLWHDWLDDICNFAMEHGIYPDWNSLDWKHTEVEYD